ncbi:MAG: CopG family transcriptional regulator [Ruminiclostridium sp.]|nr:CopG family transcriptional regulator [Ruminiclostridium sp.]
MSPRTGRPKADNPKNISIKVRFDEEISSALTAYCTKYNISRTEAIRRGLKLLLSKEK